MATFIEKQAGTNIQVEKYAVIDSDGKVIQTFRSIISAQYFIKGKRDYLSGELHVIQVKGGIKQNGNTRLS